MTEADRARLAELEEEYAARQAWRQEVLGRMSPQERAAHEQAMTAKLPELEQHVDDILRRLTGRTYRADEVVPGTAVERILAKYPELYPGSTNGLKHLAPDLEP